MHTCTWPLLKTSDPTLWRTAANSPWILLDLTICACVNFTLKLSGSPFDSEWLSSLTFDNHNSGSSNYNKLLLDTIFRCVLIWSAYYRAVQTVTLLKTCVFRSSDCHCCCLDREFNWALLSLKHVKSSVVRSGGIALRWSSGYGAGGLTPGFDIRSRHIFWRPWIFLSPLELWSRTPTWFPLHFSYLCNVHTYTFSKRSVFKKIRFRVSTFNLHKSKDPVHTDVDWS